MEYTKSETMRSTTKRLYFLFIVIPFLFTAYSMKGQPNWSAIKTNATFTVADSNYLQPTIQAIKLAGWEDGLYITRDGKHLYSTYLPLDALSWSTAIVKNPICFNFDPYFRQPLLGIDTVTNLWGCKNYINSDIIYSQRTDTSQEFNPWQQSNLHSPIFFEGGACGVLKDSENFDVFVYTKDLGDSLHMEIKLLRNISVNPSQANAVSIVSSTSQEDNPHIERLPDSSLLLFFDRDRYIYYSKSIDNGNNWQTPKKIQQILNDQSPYDVQPHLWNDGSHWWVYFCANNANGIRCIYKSKQQIANDWDSWGTKELVLEPNTISDGSGTIFGIGEPSLTQWGDLSFVVIYGKITSDTTNVYDCDPWIMKRKTAIENNVYQSQIEQARIELFPNPAKSTLSMKGADIICLHLYTMHGEEILSQKMLSNDKIILKNIANGIYFAKMIANTSVKTQIIIIEK